MTQRTGQSDALQGEWRAIAVNWARESSTAFQLSWAGTISVHPVSGARAGLHTTGFDAVAINDYLFVK